MPTQKRACIRNASVMLCSWIRIIFMKLRRGRAAYVAPIQDFCPSARVRIERGGRIILGSRTHMRARALLHALDEGVLEVGAHCYFGEGCMLVCKKHMRIGAGSSFGPYVLAYDHDHKIGVEDGFAREEYNTGDIVVGENCWIGANTVLLRGTVLGDRCVVGAGSVLKGVYPPDSRIVQKRETSVASMRDSANNRVGDETRL